MGNSPKVYRVAVIPGDGIGCPLQLKLPSDSSSKSPPIPVQSIHPLLWKGSSFTWILEQVGTLVEWALGPQGGLCHGYGSFHRMSDGRGALSSQLHASSVTLRVTIPVPICHVWRKVFIYWPTRAMNHGTRSRFGVSLMGRSPV